MGINTFPLGILFFSSIGARDIDQIRILSNARSHFWARFVFPNSELISVVRKNSDRIIQSLGV